VTKTQRKGKKLINKIHKREVLGRINRLLSFYTTRTVYKTTRPIILLLLHVLFVMETCLLSRCLRKTREETHTNTQTDEKDL
jgi:hypothetical protein